MDEFLRRLTLAVARGAIQPGDVTLATVEHDGDCPFLDDGECHCDPIIRIDHPNGMIAIDENGEARLVYTQ